MYIARMVYCSWEARTGENDRGKAEGEQQV